MPLERIKIQKWYEYTNRTISDQRRAFGTRKETTRFGTGTQGSKVPNRKSNGRKLHKLVYSWSMKKICPTCFCEVENGIGHAEWCPEPVKILEELFGFDKSEKKE